MANEFHGGFVRQRRSLNLISLVLTILVFFGIDGTEMRLGPAGGAGLTIDLLDTRFIYLGLYLMWGWFLIRYWQYFSPARADSKLDLDRLQLPRIKEYFRPLLKLKGKENYSKEAMEKFPDAVAALRCRVASRLVCCACCLSFRLWQDTVATVLRKSYSA